MRKTPPTTASKGLLQSIAPLPRDRSIGDEESEDINDDDSDVTTFSFGTI